MLRGNITIECKSITDREPFQTFGYLCGTSFPVAIFADFGTWSKVQIERYNYHDGFIKVLRAVFSPPTLVGLRRKRYICT